MSLEYVKAIAEIDYRHKYMNKSAPASDLLLEGFCDDKSRLNRLIESQYLADWVKQDDGSYKALCSFKTDSNDLPSESLLKEVLNNKYFKKFVRQQIESNFDFSLIYKSIRKDEVIEKFNARKLIAIWLIHENNKAIPNLRPVEQPYPDVRLYFSQNLSWHILGENFEDKRIYLQNYDKDSVVEMIKALGRTSGNQVKDDIKFDFEWFKNILFSGSGTNLHRLQINDFDSKLQLIERFKSDSKRLSQLLGI